MKKASTVDLGGDNYLTTGGVCTGLHFADGSENHFDQEMLGHIAEWLADAWWNLTGEEYDPEYIGVEVDADEFDALVGLERDCE